MAEKQTILKPLAMKLFATWELDRTPPNCIPRMCNLSMTHLEMNRSLGGEITSVILAVRMLSSKRILRSNEIPISTLGTVDTDLQLSFSLQYPHFLKRDGNTLQVMLQRKKKYKNRTILGFKTLAIGHINMSQVLQRPMDRELELYSEDKDKGPPLARVTLVSVSSQPVDSDDAAERHKYLDNADRSVDMADVYSDDDEDFSSPDEGSDSEPIAENVARRSVRTNARAKSIPGNAMIRESQRNLKQKFVALLKRFKVTEGLQDFDQDQDLETRAGDVDPADIEDLFDELEDLSDSGPEMDTISVTSTPKPSLRPYFSSRLILNDGHEGSGAEKTSGVDRMSDESSKKADSDHADVWTDQEHSDSQCLASSPPRDDKNKGNNKAKLFIRDRSNMSLKERKSISSSALTPRQEKLPALEKPSLPPVIEQPRKVLLENLSRSLPLEDPDLPDHVFIVNSADSHGPALSVQLTELGSRVIGTASTADIRATVSHIVAKLQKLCNSGAKTTRPLKIGLIGSDSHICSILRPYVKELSAKPPDFQNHIRFLVIPFGFCSLAKYLSSVDAIYGATFASESWRELVERWEKSDIQELLSRIMRYVTQAPCTLPLPIAEAMLTYKGRSGEDDSMQAFVPFITEVCIGMSDILASSVDLDDLPAASPSTSMTYPSSPPMASVTSSGSERPKESITPPSSPNINTGHACRMLGELQEPLDLQVDYWLSKGGGSAKEDKGDGGKGGGLRAEGGKYTLKTSFRNLQVTRLTWQTSVAGQEPSTCFTLAYSTKEKKQRIMRLGKKKEKERDNDCRKEVVEGISRLLVSAKNQSFTVNIDSSEWSNVKFFQLSSQWQRQIKTFPISLFTMPDSII